MHDASSSDFVLPSESISAKKMRNENDIHANFILESGCPCAIVDVLFVWCLQVLPVDQCSSAASSRSGQVFALPVNATHSLSGLAIVLCVCAMVRRVGPSLQGRGKPVRRTKTINCRARSGSGSSESICLYIISHHPPRNAVVLQGERSGM